MSKKTIRSLVALAAAASMAGAVCLAQSSGAATYKAKCQSCHGTAGIPSAGIAKLWGVKPITETVKKLSEAQMIAIAEDGKGKMPAYKGKLTEAQIKDAVIYYRGLAK